MQQSLSVEGHMPTQAEMERKASSGPDLLKNLAGILSEFPSHNEYDPGVELDQIVPRCKEAVHVSGYTLVDASHLFNNINDGLLLLERWATLVHTARTSKQMLLVRRTPQNSAAVLVIQRLEHLRGMVSEMAPMAFAVLVRDDQLLVTRDQITTFDDVKRKILHMATTEELCPLCGIFLRARVATVFKCGHVVHSDCFAQYLEKANTCPTCRAPVGDVKPVELDITEELAKFRDRDMQKDHNMLPAMFSQEISLIRSLRESTLECKPVSAPPNARDSTEGVKNVQIAKAGEVEEVREVEEVGEVGEEDAALKKDASPTESTTPTLSDGSAATDGSGVVVEAEAEDEAEPVEALDSVAHEPHKEEVPNDTNIE